MFRTKLTKIFELLPNLVTLACHILASHNAFVSEAKERFGQKMLFGYIFYNLIFATSMTVRIRKT